MINLHSLNLSEEIILIQTKLPVCLRGPKVWWRLLERGPHPSHQNRQIITGTPEKKASLINPPCSVLKLLTSSKFVGG